MKTKITSDNPSVLKINTYKWVTSHGVFWDILGLFVPVPRQNYFPTYVLWGYGFCYSIAFGKHIPLGWIMIVVALIF